MCPFAANLQGVAPSVRDNLRVVKQRIARACAAAGRDASSVLLVAVSKTFAPSAVRAAAQAGQREFGENYAQEGAAKMSALADLPLAWHYIGPIQSNKTRLIAAHYDWVHTIDREKIAARLSEARDPARPPLQVCIQVNVSGEETKSGVAPDEALALARSIAPLPNLKLRGLMAIPEPADDPALARARYAQLRDLKAEIQRGGLELDTLSMGMSADLEIAIGEGATIVRVGTAIFGRRQ